MEKDLDFSSYSSPGFPSQNQDVISPVDHQTPQENLNPQTSVTSQHYRISAPYGSRAVESLADPHRGKPQPPSYCSTQYSNSNSSSPWPAHPVQFSDYMQNNYTESAGRHNSAACNSYHSKNPRSSVTDYRISSFNKNDSTWTPPAQSVGSISYISQSSGVYNLQPPSNQIENTANHEEEKNTDVNRKQESDDVYPVAVTFINRKTGIEYLADGSQVQPKALDHSNPFSQQEVTVTPIQASHIDNSGQSYISSQLQPYPNTQLQPYPNTPLQPYPNTQSQPYPSSQSQPYELQHKGNQRWRNDQLFAPAVVAQQPFYSSQTVLQSPPPKVSNYIPLSIVVTLCFCWPLGLLALSKAREANRLRDAGKHPEAAEKASSSLTTNIIAIILGIIIIGASVGYYVWSLNM